jgi:hypothetical protein
MMRNHQLQRLMVSRRTRLLVGLTPCVCYVTVQLDVVSTVQQRSLVGTTASPGTLPRPLFRKQRYP